MRDSHINLHTTLIRKKASEQSNALSDIGDEWTKLLSYEWLKDRHFNVTGTCFRQLKCCLISWEVDCVCALQLHSYGKSCTIETDKILLKENTFLEYNNISLIISCHINFDMVDSYERLIKKNVISTHTPALLLKWCKVSVTCCTWFAKSLGKADGMIEWRWWNYYRLHDTVFKTFFIYCT